MRHSGREEVWLENAPTPGTTIRVVVVDDAFVEAVEDFVGMGCGAWDMVDPKAICGAVLSIASEGGRG